MQFKEVRYVQLMAQAAWLAK